MWVKATMAWEEMAHNNLVTTEAEIGEGGNTWVKPDALCFKLNYDAAIRAGFISFNWIPRVSNRVAHYLACVGNSSSNELVWIDSIPLILSNVLKLDFYQ
ncbi:uncharacterized protein G2W53_001098 [Senna tora]|uniref:RNase H type-1 domain-containing protein n=1 Tax=Senna tora TaxID=362788 RepID=A0A834XF95_9FABA|nr:uncharacterized protein G2W53_001098 [Senna tora]